VQRERHAQFSLSDHRLFITEGDQIKWGRKGPTRPVRKESGPAQNSLSVPDEAAKTGTPSGPALDGNFSQTKLGGARRRRNSQGDNEKGKGFIRRPKLL